MIEIINTKKENLQIGLEDITDAIWENEFIVYKRVDNGDRNNNSWCVLRNINPFIAKGKFKKYERFGFLPLVNYPLYKPTYCATTWQECIEKCTSAGKKIFVFKDIHEFYNYYTK